MVSLDYWVLDSRKKRFASLVPCIKLYLRQFRQFKNYYHYFVYSDFKQEFEEILDYYNVDPSFVCLCNEPVKFNQLHYHYLVREPASNPFKLQNQIRQRATQIFGNSSRQRRFYSKRVATKYHLLNTIIYIQQRFHRNSKKRYVYWHQFQKYSSGCLLNDAEAIQLRAIFEEDPEIQEGMAEERRKLDAKRERYFQNKERQRAWREACEAVANPFFGGNY